MPALFGQDKKPQLMAVFRFIDISFHIWFADIINHRRVFAFHAASY